MAPLVDAVASTIKDRSSEFRNKISRRLGEFTGDARGIVHTLELFRLYTRHIEASVEADANRNVGDDVKLELLSGHLKHLNDRVLLFDDRFSRGHQQVPRFLITAIEESCAEMCAEEQQAVLTIGPPGNFGTIVDDLKDLLFRDLSPQPALPAHLEEFSPVMITLPEIEGARVPWHPVSVGHEFAHYFNAVKPITLNQDAGQLLDQARLDAMSLPLSTDLDPVSKLRNMKILLSKWQDELICDAYAVHRYGPAGVAALAEFLQGIGGIELRSRTHPPGFVRIELMLKWLDLQTVPESLAGIIAPFKELANQPSDLPEWMEYLCGILRGVSDTLWGDVKNWVDRPMYDYASRAEVITWLADRLEHGIPGGEIADIASGEQRVTPTDVVNGCWLATANGAETPVNRLAAKALDNLEFLSKWAAAGGDLPTVNRSDEIDDIPGALSRDSILARLNTEGNSRLLVTPTMPDAADGCSYDVRLGNHFIIFHQSSAAAFDALEKSQDPRSMQYAIEKAWGESFYLHPNQLVLASTFEYIVLPDDLTAQVATRSSYGRLGMLSATAVQVHPNYSGCLTLELVNLGEMPLTITPGERVAQLVFTKTTKRVAPLPNPKYRYPTGPEFSKVRDDKESQVLRAMRQNFRNRRFGSG
jgi:deoxycytidine triphosphate deaminase